MKERAHLDGPGGQEAGDCRTGHRRRLALSALLACAALIGAVSLGALAQQPAPAETASPAVRAPAFPPGGRGDPLPRPGAHPHPGPRL